MRRLWVPHRGLSTGFLILAYLSEIAALADGAGN